MRARRMGIEAAAAGLAAAIVWLAASPAFAFDPFLKENGDVADGNSALAQGKTKEALSSYDEAARELPNRGEVHLDRGLALLRSGDDKIDQAMQALKIAVAPESAPRVRARALANLGDAFFRKEDFEAAIEHYKKSLMLAPGNRNAAWNLEVAVQKQKKKEEQQKQDQQKQDQQKQDQQKQEQEQEQEQQQQQEQQASQPKTRQEMEQMLDALDRDQQSLAQQQARRRAVAMPAAPIKDW